jgi:hypothetical protein
MGRVYKLRLGDGIIYIASVIKMGSGVEIY